MPKENSPMDGYCEWKRRDTNKSAKAREEQVMDLSEKIGQKATVVGFIQRPDGDVLIDDPDRIVQYRAVALAEGLEEGTEAEVLWAWQWLADHPEVTNRLQGWFARRAAELRTMGRIK